jgi:hypothetical protein
MGSGTSAPAAWKASRSAASASATARRDAGPEIEPMHAKLLADVKVVGEHRYETSRAAAESFMDNLSLLLRDVRGEPEMDGDRSLGLRLSGIRRGTLLAGLGFCNDDRLEAINGDDVRTPVGLMGAYANNRHAKVVHVVVLRDGATLTLTYAINDPD